MKLIEKVVAYKAIREMMKEDWDFNFIYRLTKLMTALEPDYTLFCNEEMKLVAAYGKKEENGKVALDGDGIFSFAGEGDMHRYQEKHRELEHLEVTAPARAEVKAPGQMRGEWLRAIGPFCDFYGEGTENGEAS